MVAATATAAIIGSVERRRGSQQSRSPIDLLQEVPALVLLERLPVPILAIAEDGSIVFANSAFAAMLGYAEDEVKALKFGQIFHTLPADDSAVSAVRAHENLIVELVHQDGSIVRARMSKSAMQRDSDPVALAAFQDLTEQLWIEEM